jgi:fermentation-respiration switch protein FrsA (DUF1100 family)
MIQRVILAFAFLAVVLVAVLALIWLGQRRLIYFPDTGLPSLDRAGLTGTEAVTFETADHVRLGGWFVAGSGQSPRPTVIVFGGNAGHREYRAPLATALRQHGLNVLLVDYRGYGSSGGTPTEDGLAADARAARSYLFSRTDVDPARIVYFGESLGAAVAVRLAVEHPPAALILRSPFASLADIGRHHYPLLPVRLLLRDRFASIDRAHRLGSPVLVVAGTRDTIVPIEHTRRLFEAITAPKTLVELAADHNDEALLDGEEMIQSIVRFLEGLNLAARLADMLFEPLNHH